MTVKRAFCYSDIVNRNFKTLDFTGEWLEHIGKPQRSGIWTIYGYTGNGKTSYEMKLAKYLCSFEKVHINSLEEGMKESFKQALIRNNMKSVKSKFTFQKETYDELVARLQRKRQPKIIFIDSLQYFLRRKKIEDVFRLEEMFPDTLFIFIAHALKSGQIKGSLAEDVLYHSDCKINIKDYCATIETSRYGGVKPVIVYEKGYNDRRLKLINKG